MRLSILLALAVVTPLLSAEIRPELVPVLAESSGQTVKAWVLFTDKGLATRSEREAALQAIAESYAPRAIERRQRRRSAPGLFDERDLPVAPRYIEAVQATGARVLVTTRWVNGVSVRATTDQLQAVAQFPFVRTITPVRRSADIRPRDLEPVAPDETAATRDFYGLASAQLLQLNIPAAHAAGYTGMGVVIGVLDTGFHRTHQAYNQPGHPLMVLGEYDFVDDDGNTQIEPGDDPGQHRHGTLVLSTIGAYKPDTFVGGAYDAAFVLAKTEDVTQEVPAEEDQYVAGLEFIEAAGADVATSSLGYIDWYTQSDLDGQSAVTTLAVNVATDNGLVCVTAAGNSGNDTDPATSHLIAPADAYEVLTCGAVDEFGTMAFFSSDGPTADGRVKPELLARGWATACIYPDNDTDYTAAYGTSLSTPLVAAAAALVIDAHPDWTVTRVRSALLKTAADYLANGQPDPLYVRGYGILDVLAAINYVFPDGDTDGDGDKDLRDFAHVQGCFRGARVSAPSGCELADLDGDADVDASDYRIFTVALAGPQ